MSRMKELWLALYEEGTEQGLDDEAASQYANDMVASKYADRVDQAMMQLEDSQLEADNAS